MRRIAAWTFATALMATLPILTRAQSQEAMQKAMAGCGPSNAQFLVKFRKEAVPVSPNHDVAHINVFDNDISSRIFSGGAVVRVGVDGSWVGALKGFSWISIPLGSGTHHICLEWEGAHDANGVALEVMHVKAGESYYLVADNFNWTMVPTVLTLEEVNADEGRLLMAEWPSTVTTPKEAKRP